MTLTSMWWMVLAASAILPAHSQGVPKSARSTAQVSQPAENFQTPLQLVNAMIMHEDQGHNDRYEYTLNERSERTGGHLWTERVVEIPAGRVMRLMAEDGKPLSLERAQAEHDRLNGLATDPAVFDKAQLAAANEEIHARQMLALLPKAFLLDNPRLENGMWHVDYHPDPHFSPTGIEQHVLHGMSGSLVIDAHDLRLVHIDGHMASDLSMDLGLLSIHRGSHFSSDREKIGGHWRTVHVVTDIRGKATLFNVAKNSEIARSDFHYLPGDVNQQQAIALLEQ